MDIDFSTTVSDTMSTALWNMLKGLLTPFPLTILFLALAFLILRWYLRTPKTGYAYDAKPIMNEMEWACHEALLQAAGRDYHVFAQVSLYAIAQHQDGAGWPRIAQKSCDFVLVSTQTRKTALVIEVDGKQHKTSERQKRSDSEKDAVLAACGIPVLRIPSARRYNPDQLASAIQDKLQDSQG